MRRSAWKGALLVSGEPGTGKSRWIRDEAAANRAAVFRWNTRVDRSLREGREILHQQVRSKEPLFVWIEGADDLTQEAQAFLRRILETASANVVCALEVRELWKMSAPVLSRCTVISMKSDRSFRAIQCRQKAHALGILGTESLPVPVANITWKDIPALRNAAADPYQYIEQILQDTSDSDAIEAVRAIGSGSSPWIQLTNYLIKKGLRPEGV
jgi:hypothetical protein